ncbi:unnamed protein product [Arabidopsis thaliana]|uniref:(thale cress) hypothetical protein n=1 Tax=Arabidopsis thaliana TaxID=3702 RepID=A0A7G2EYC6_ARATH|nr:unnamed protein product [Arabidopsis thaliana]
MPISFNGSSDSSPSEKSDGFDYYNAIRDGNWGIPTKCYCGRDVEKGNVVGGNHHGKTRFRCPLNLTEDKREEGPPALQVPMFEPIHEKICIMNDRITELETQLFKELRSIRSAISILRARGGRGSR